MMQNQESMLVKVFNWNDTMLRETGKQAIEDTLVENNDLFAKHRTEIRVIKGFEVKLIPTDDKVVYHHNLSMTIHLKKKDLIAE